MSTPDTVNGTSGMERRLIVAGYLGKWGETDGVVTTYSNLMAFLSLSRCRYDLLCYGPADSVEENGNVTIITHRPRLPIRIDPSRWVDPLLLSSTTAAAVCRRKYSIVQCSSPEAMGWLAVRAARVSGCPLVAVYHTALDEYARIRYERLAGRTLGRIVGAIMSNYIARFYRQADAILVPSHCMQRQLTPYFRAPIRVLSRGVDMTRFSPRHRRRHGGPVRALYVGRIAPEKNLKLLVRTFSEIRDAELIIVGDGPYLEEMKRVLPYARYIGRLTGLALSQAYADADLFVFPSRTDTLGNVVLEALSSGLPVVVTDSLGPKELVDHGRTGLVADSDEAFGQAVHALISDDDRRYQMGRQARISVQNRSWADIAAQLVRFHDELAAGSSRREETATEAERESMYARS